MSEPMIVAFVGLAGSVICALIASRSAAKTVSAELAQKLEITQAVNNEKLETLTAEVRRHNDFATRVPVLEREVKALNHRVEKLESFHTKE